jgi:RIO kinase 1
MRIPESLTSLADQGLIDDVVRPLMSGKEAEVFLVRVGGELRVAKVYKAAQNRSFKNRAEYTEGRKVRNSRDQRAIEKRSRHGRAQDEAAWRSTEVDMIYRLRDAGVRVPIPHHYIDGVLVMEMVADADGAPAPRLAEVSLDRDEAILVFQRLLAETVRMLSAGVVHGDLSDFNVLMSAEGPVIIDFPQSVDAASNQNARKLLLRDVENLKRFLVRFAPDQRPGPFAEEMWELYSMSALTPDTRLTGRHRASERRANTDAVLDLIGDANYDERKRRERAGVGMRGVPEESAPRPVFEAREPKVMRPPKPVPPVYQGRPQHPAQHARPAHAQHAQPQHAQQPRPAQHQGQQPRAPQGQQPRAPQGQQPRAPQGQQPRAPQGQQPRAPQHPAQQARPPQPQGQHPRAPQQPRAAEQPREAPRPPQHHAAPHQAPRQAAHPTPHQAPRPPQHHAAPAPPPPRADEGQGAPPRRRVVISVSTTEPRAGSRRDRGRIETP